MPPIANNLPSTAPPLDFALNARRDARRLGLLPLVCVMYLVVSGGAYGLEDAVHLAGPRLTLLLCLIVPLTLSIPTALMAAELTALMPVEGGFYFWVKAGMGPFAGFAEAYLTILYTAMDMAIYPVLFAGYLSFIVPLGPLAQIAIGIVLVWLSGLMNFLGVRPVGFASIALAGVLIAPFFALVVLGMPELIHFRMPAIPLFGADAWGALGAGLTVVIWNFSGWENLSVVSGEIENPRRNYLRAIMIALPVIVAGYVLPLAISISGAASVADWGTGSFSHVGYRIGGTILGGALAIGGAVMSFAVFAAAMLWVSRMPYVLARERYLPKSLTEIWASTVTPGKSILLCCVVFTMLVPVGFVALVVLDVFFYMAALALEMAALIRLRRLMPNREGLFTVGGGVAGLALVTALPVMTWVATFGLAISSGAGKPDFILAVVLGVCVWPAYSICRRRYGGPPAIDPPPTSLTD
ncbi:MAG: APC family permease [Candidatus Binatus sp.]|uniref:APC family permease n=1 Tax=Candidatus Binatus sp. TaxID=2811406 RepID=UPI0027180769|nr:APC family permease [Candidatus Binatus sp.]MDO8434682.1 APC family permease [Candidatus Binatus sp.]